MLLYSIVYSVTVSPIPKEIHCNGINPFTGFKTINCSFAGDICPPYIWNNIKFYNDRMLGDVPPHDDEFYNDNNIQVINRLSVYVQTNQTEFILVELNESYHINFQNDTANLVAANNFGLARGLATLI